MTAHKVTASERAPRLSDTTYKDYYRFRAVIGDMEAKRHYKLLLDTDYRPPFDIPRFDRTSGRMVEIISAPIK